MDTRSATTQIRLANWANIIQARNESGLTIKEYCERNGLSRHAYFYWLRKLRTIALETAEPRFVEIQAPPHSGCANVADAAVSVELGNARIHVSDPSSRETFAMIMEVLGYAE